MGVEPLGELVKRESDADGLEWGLEWGLHQLWGSAAAGWPHSSPGVAESRTESPVSLPVFTGDPKSQALP